MKTAIKDILYTTGLYSLYHRGCNQNSLTTLMLHRVLPKHLQKMYGSNPEWTLSDSVFCGLLKFINKHYSVVPIHAVDNILEREIVGSKPALLLTFDDGWLDNYQYAYPELIKTQTPATIFLATDHIGSQLGFWQEKIYAAIQLKPELLDTLKHFTPDPDNTHDAGSLIQQLNSVEPVEANCKELMEIVNRAQCNQRQMLNREEIFEMSKNGISFGSHGASHRPLATLDKYEIDQEIDRSSSALQSITGVSPKCVSFPHGSFSNTVQLACTRYGLVHQFCSKPAIRSVKKQKTRGSNFSNVFPRMHLAERTISQRMHFSTAKAANSLFRLPRQ